MSRSQFNKSKSAASKALILCILMIISSLANMNVNEIYPSSELEERNISSTSNLSIGQAIGEEWMMSFINEEPTQIFEHNITHTLLSTYLDGDGSNPYKATLYLSDGNNITQLLQLSTSNSYPLIRVVQSDVNSIVYFEKNSSSLCEIKQYNFSTGQKTVQSTFSGEGCQYEDSVINSDGGVTILVRATDQVTANGASHNSVRSSTFGQVCWGCAPICQYTSKPQVFVVMGINSNGNERWQVGGSGYSDEFFMIAASGNNSSIISAKMTQTSVASQCGGRPTWQVGSNTFNSNSRMYFEIDTNGNVLSSSSSGTAHRYAKPINESHSVRIDYGAGGTTNNYCNNQYDCYIIFNAIQSGAEVNRIAMNLTGESYIQSPKIVSANGDVLLTMCLENSNSQAAGIFDSQYSGYPQAVIKINSSMSITIQEVGTTCGGPINSVVIEGYGEGTYIQGNTNGFHFSAQPIQQWQGDQYVLRKFSIDSDRDYMADAVDPFPYDTTQQYDSDEDGYGDNSNGNNADECPSIFGLSWRDKLGCQDSDGDGQSDTFDAFPINPTQWIDSDFDGFGDNSTGFRGDSCPNTFGLSTVDVFGCVDSDQDGRSDINDAFVSDSTQWSDWDDDGFGDELIGYEGDACPSQYGNSTNDRYGCVDDDGDGWSNTGDDFINNPTQYSDIDGDGYGDNQSTGATMSDAFPNDGTQWNDTDGDGHGDNQYGNQGDWFPNDPSRWQDSDGDGYADEDDAFINDASQWNDTDGDGYGDEANGNQADAFPNDPLEWQDSDGDGYGNNADAFPVDGTQWNDTDGDGHGDNPYGTQGDWFPNDPNRWQDSDQDGYADEDDAFVNDASQWNDSDGDGYGDEANGNRADEFPDDPLEWQDSDGDGYGNNADAFPVDGTQWNDTDGDGYGDNPYGTQGDWFPNDPNRWQDSDRDGYADEDDLFPNEITQWNDTDGDGFGDNLNGNNGDVFPNDSSEWKDSDEDGVGNNADQYPYDPTQTIDFDGDGYGDNTNGTRGDAFPQDGTEWSDLDGDGIGNNADLFPSDGTQWNDTDSDGYGDNLNGANGDACPLISGNSSIILLGCTDSDGDGYADQIDAFISDALSWSDVDGDSIPDELDAYPNDATQSLDSDGDGFGDNPVGTNADKFPDDPIQWGDIDGDGYGDNPAGNNSDAFITDATQWADSDGDGYGDNPQGRLYDMFPDNPTQWLDEDGDGLGDNQSGTDADPYLDDFDNDGYNDSIDILPKLASPGDLDADGCLDEVDNFTADPNECLDTDGDGVGNNADSDDDGDGWTDADEIRLNADPLSASNQPVDSFEIVIPGTAVGLGAWDLIGIFGGVPLFAWLAFGFATRNSRCGRYEDLLNQANSRDELEQVALRWEYSLMLRMLGPHQGIRLERLRAELDDRFENSEPEEIGVNQTSIVEREAKDLPPIEAKSESTPSKDTPATSTDDEGYEWLKTDDGIDWYRAAESGDEWAKFES